MKNVTIKQRLIFRHKRYSILLMYFYDFFCSLQYEILKKKLFFYKAVKNCFISH